MASASVTTNWQEEVLRREIRRHADTLAKFANKLEYGENYPNETPKIYAGLVSHLADVCSRYVESTPSQMLQQLSVFLCAIGNTLQHVERSRIAHTPWSMIQAKETFLNLCAGEDTRFLISPQWEYNYSISSSEIVSALRRMMSSFDWIPNEEWERSSVFAKPIRIYFVSFPRAERNNALLHAILAHEVGHIVTQQKVEAEFSKIWLREEIAVEQALTNEAGKRYEKAVPDIQLRTTIAQRDASRWAEHAKAVLLQGLKELIADAVAIHLYGPAAFAALSEMSCRFDFDANPVQRQNYPPWRYRLRLVASVISSDLQDIVSSEASTSSLAAYCKWLTSVADDVTASTPDKANIDSNPATKEAYRLIEKHLPELQSEALALLPNDLSLAYSLGGRKAEVQGLVEKLENSIPPNESGDYPNTTPANIADILNAAWACKLGALDDDVAWASTDNMEGLFRLVLKAIESSHVQQEYGPKLKTV